MRKKKGFTLIELLAVIVILAVIALIATPIILGVIDDSKRGSAESSALGYIDAIEKQSVSELLNENDNLRSGIYDAPMEELEINGSAPSAGWLVINKGQVVNYSIVVGDYVITKGKETTKGDTPLAKPVGPTKGTIEYFNPETKESCDLSSAISDEGTKTGCMKWYVYKDNGDDTYQLILDHNTTALVAWSNDSSNHATEPETSWALAVKTQLNNDISTWNTSLSARLITASEIAELVGADSDENVKWSSTKQYKGTVTDINIQSSWFYLDGGKSTNKTTYSSTDGWQKKYSNDQRKSEYGWLFDNTNDCIADGCNVESGSNVGYWTSTPVNGDDYRAWYIRRNGSMGLTSVEDSSLYGVRPVITISKYDMSWLNY